MARVYWKGLSEDQLEDGRRLLNVEFEDKETGEILRWTPRWAHTLRLVDRAYEVEVSNEINSCYVPVLAAARHRFHERPKVSVEVSMSVGSEWKWCPDCDWHDFALCSCPVCTGLGVHD